MHYWAEVIRQTGESVVYDTMQKRDVEAWAYDLGISYDWDVYSDPNLSLEYAFGSGDSDRVSVTDTLDGNISGDDKNFHYFGYLPAGYALSPRLSNLQFAKAAVLFKPLEKYKLFKNFSLGIDYYRYFKDEKDGGIYDTEAINSDTDIGDEVDLTIFWQILSDLTLELQYGYFMPGDAYPDAFDDSEQYYSASMTLSY